MVLFFITMGNSNNLDHAKHNEEVYRYLTDHPEYCDWIITTAFYSSIHYVRHKIFPYKGTLKNGKEIEYNDFESLYFNFRKDSEGRHGFQLNWVKKNYEEIKFPYRRLHELSNEARYINYQFDTKKLLPEINLHLKKIRLYCKK